VTRPAYLRFANAALTLGALTTPTLAACARDRTSPRAAEAIASPVPAVTEAGLGGDEKAAAARITAAAISAPIRYLADDLLEGRAPGTRGDELAIKYIASRFEEMGLEPGGEGGGWLQRVPLVGITPGLPRSITLLGPNHSKLSLAAGVDVVIRPGQQRADLAFDATDVVFVGYGIVAPRYAWDDYKNVDVRGKVVLLMNNDPADDPQLFEGKARTWYGRWDYKFMEAARHGAVAAILVHTDASAGYPWHVVTSTWSGSEKFNLPAGREPRLVATRWATEDASRNIAALGGKNLDALRASAETRTFVPVSLGVRLGLSLRVTMRDVGSANVIGVLRGRDGALADGAVVISAHHDHLGIGPPKNGDAIYNGAIDNASGVATMLAIAQAAADSPRTRRSLVFLATTAEEQGLLGAEWYVRHPTVPLARVAADLNIDGVNHLGPATDVGYIGYGRTSLDAVVDAIARTQGRTVHGSPFPERGSFFRSDQFSFARSGVPTVFLKGGPTFVGHPPEWGLAEDETWTQTHYHQPSDEFDPSWDLRGAVDDARLLLLTALRVANADAMPVWRAGDEFEAKRRESLAAAK
jgi:Zn-dependent M28 family amino/carboxypeptidase